MDQAGDRSHVPRTEGEEQHPESPKATIPGFLVPLVSLETEHRLVVDDLLPHILFEPLGADSCFCSHVDLEEEKESFILACISNGKDAVGNEINPLVGVLLRGDLFMNEWLAIRRPFQERRSGREEPGPHHRDESLNLGQLNPEGIDQEVVFKAPEVFDNHVFDIGGGIKNLSIAQQVNSFFTKGDKPLGTAAGSSKAIRVELNQPLLFETRKPAAQSLRISLVKNGKLLDGEYPELRDRSQDIQVRLFQSKSHFLDSRSNKRSQGWDNLLD